MTLPADPQPWMDTPSPWEPYFEAYTGAVRRYAGKFALPASAVEGVLQEAFVEWIAILERGGGARRRSLLACAHRAAVREERRVRFVARVSGGTTDGVNGAAGGGGRLPAEPVQKAWREALIEEVLAGVQRDPALEPRTISVFRDYVLLSRPAAEVAQRHGVTVNMVYQVKNRLARRTQEVLAELWSRSTSEVPIELRRTA